MRVMHGYKTDHLRRRRLYRALNVIATSATIIEAYVRMASMVGADIIVVGLHAVG